ncbi:hypothetical protein ACFLSQ_00350 [Bacteroidota bacterium]
MKPKLLILLFTFLSFSGYLIAEKYDNMRFDMSLNYFKENGIKSFTFTEYEYEFGVPKRIGNKIQEITFDGDYRITESKLFDEGEYDGKFTYIFNANGDTISITKYGAEEEELFKTEFRYDGNGRLVEKEYYEDGESIMKDMFTNNDKGNRTILINYEKNEIEFTNKYQYNENNQETEWTRYDDEDVLELKGVSNYNEKGWKTDSTYFYEGEVDVKSKYDYDESGRLIAYTLYEGDGSLFSKNSYKYNIEGQLIEERIFDSYNVLIEMYLLEYNNDGQVKEINKYGEKEFLEEIRRYKYHENSLIKHEQILNNIEVLKFIRKYTYDPSQH